MNKNGTTARSFYYYSMHKTENKVRVVTGTISDSNAQMVPNDDGDNKKARVAGLLQGLLDHINDDKKLTFHYAISKQEIDLDKKSDKSKENSHRFDTDIHATITDASGFGEATSRFEKIFKDSLPEDDKDWFTKPVIFLSNFESVDGGVAVGYGFMPSNRIVLGKSKKEIIAEFSKNNGERLREEVQKILAKFPKSKVQSLIKDYRSELEKEYGPELVEVIIKELK